MAIPASRKTYWVPSSMSKSVLFLQISSLKQVKFLDGYLIMQLLSMCNVENACQAAKQYVILDNELREVCSSLIQSPI